MRGHTQPPIIVPVEDAIMHSEDNGFECDDSDCICHDEEWSDADDAFISPLDLSAHNEHILDAIYGDVEF